MFAFHPPPSLSFGRQPCNVNLRPIEIHNTLAPCADQMVMLFCIGIKPGLALKEMDSGNKTVFVKGAQGPVDRVQRNGRHLFSYVAKYVLRGGVIVSIHYFEKYLQALRRHLDALFFADSSKQFDSMFGESFRCSNHLTEPEKAAL